MDDFAIQDDDVIYQPKDISIEKENSDNSIDNEDSISLSDSSCSDGNAEEDPETEVHTYLNSYYEKNYKYYDVNKIDDYIH